MSIRLEKDTGGDIECPLCLTKSAAVWENDYGGLPEPGIHDIACIECCALLRVEVSTDYEAYLPLHHLKIEN